MGHHIIICAVSFILTPSFLSLLTSSGGCHLGVIHTPFENQRILQLLRLLMVDSPLLSEPLWGLVQLERVPYPRFSLLPIQ